jgi:hypothetical protein
MPAEDQATSLTFGYAQSTYGIVALNETMPAFMARNYTLAPFQLKDAQLDVTSKGTFIAPTTMYTLDLVCENVSHRADGTVSTEYLSKDGCNSTLGLTGNLTFGEEVDRYTPVMAIKGYTGQYIGYHNFGAADYYLSPYCPESENGTFFASFAQSKVRTPLELQNQMDASATTLRNSKQCQHIEAVPTSSTLAS